MDLKCKKKQKKTTHSKNILHGDTLYNIERKKCKTVCSEWTFTKVVLIFALFAM